MFTLRLAGLSGILMVLAAVTPSWASDYANARKDGPVNLSYACPAGSTWDPRGGGKCRSCPPGSNMVMFECRHWVPPIAARAVHVYDRQGFLAAFEPCKAGSFPAGVSAGCYRCPRGLIHNSALPVEVPGVCFRAPRVENYPAKAVANMPTLDLINPTKIGERLRKLGCARYGAKSFFDPIGGGSCWSCPGNHPQRTVSPVNGHKACATRACGARDHRPCMITERFPSCDRGLIENPISNTCVPPPNLTCYAAIGAVKGALTLVREAQQAGKAVSLDELNRVPGLSVLLNLVQGQVSQLSPRPANC